MTKYTDATVEGFTNYWQARGVQLPINWNESLINASLLIASEWIDGVYGPSFIGYKTGGFLQERAWPRTDAVVVNATPYYTFGTNDIPSQVISAVYEAAYRQSASPGSLLIDYKPGKYTKVSIDGAISVEYAGFNFASEVQATFPRIDQLLINLLDGAGTFSSYSGAISRV